MTKWEESDAYLHLRADMMADLRLRGLTATQYTNMVDEYMKLWVMSQQLDEDIARRGVYVRYQNGLSQKGTMENKSVGLRAKLSSQMLSIWIALGFREAAKGKPASVGDEFDEL